ncbi:hypothetical protein HFV04_023940 [Pseudomonas sp. BIGb0427]|uniref:hypothetical protein n=1 Tax=unclassified Pseudomonas TaxID=196821 RepID=UPI0016974752|nr:MULTISPECIES: hypothetical protein [unclassified Pseudomonas]NLU59072.1 hypothetical protein [Pseudomonas sp. BIGb0427]QPG62543.1 hypothetical protein HFV04_023940 [Pseudomonas sp. BIGb0427]UVM64888.1 hypothetical protein LOY34_16225 [Pseudomonas sp. B21-009]
MDNPDYYPFHLFAATFESETHARQFAFEQWQPEPPASASAAEFAAWEDRNPSWQLAQELELFMDSDFVELDASLDYVQSLMADEAQKAQLCSRSLDAFSHFIIVGDNAIYGDRRSADHSRSRQPQSTATLTYLGHFN